MSTNEAKPTPSPQGMIVALLDNALSCIKHNEPDRALWRIVTARLQAELNDAMRYSGCPDGVPLSGWCAYLACIRRAAIACMEINDSGESYSHDNADGAQALANLFSALNGEPP